MLSVSFVTQYAQKNANDSLFRLIDRLSKKSMTLRIYTRGNSSDNHSLLLLLVLILWLAVTGKIKNGYQSALTGSGPYRTKG
jgi:hypothetical protein